MPLTLRSGDALALDLSLAPGVLSPLRGCSLGAPCPALAASAAGRVLGTRASRATLSAVPPPAPAPSSSGIGNSVFEARRRWRADQLPSKRFRTPDSIGQISEASLSMK